MLHSVNLIDPLPLWFHFLIVNNAVKRYSHYCSSSCSSSSVSFPPLFPQEALYGLKFPLQGKAFMRHCMWMMNLTKQPPF